jgi:aromatic-L-amino-acid decarboxylase
MVDWVIDYHTRVAPTAPVRSTVTPGYLRPLLPAALPQKGEPFASIMAEVTSKIVPGLTHWQAPTFAAWYPAHTTYPGLLGELLSGSINAIGFSWASCPAGTELESIVLDWLADALGLPAPFRTHHAGEEGGGEGGAPPTRGPGGGVIQCTASDAVLVALLAAKAKALGGWVAAAPGQQGGVELAAEDAAAAAAATRLVAYTSDQAHSCVRKACMVAGIVHLRELSTEGRDDWALQAGAVEAAVAADLAAGLTPCLVVATIGTTATCAVDDVAGIGEVLGRLFDGPRRPWLHVDGAYAGTAAVCPEHRPEPAWSGLASADSFSTNAHKALLTPFDCAPLWVADAAFLRAALSLTPSFLRGTANDLDFRDWQVPLGRRLRSLKLWMVFRSYGLEGLQGFVRHAAALAARFEEHVLRDARFEVAAPRRLGLVCFRLKEDGDGKKTAALIEAVNAGGVTMMVTAEVGGRLLARAAIGGAGTQAAHIDKMWDAVVAGLGVGVRE